jgi:hypothetical protein
MFPKLNSLIDKRDKLLEKSKPATRPTTGVAFVIFENFLDAVTIANEYSKKQLCVLEGED